jgi:hypothetical protein
MRSNRFGNIDNKEVIDTIIIPALTDVIAVNEEFILNIGIVNSVLTIMMHDGSFLVKSSNPELRKTNALLSDVMIILKSITLPIYEVYIITKQDQHTDPDPEPKIVSLFYRDNDTKQQLNRQIEYFSSAASMRNQSFADYIFSKINISRELSNPTVRDSNQLDNYNKEETTCNICFEDLSGDLCKVNNSQCTHPFHCKCLQSYYRAIKSRNQNTPMKCPMCRAEPTDTYYDLIKLRASSFGRKRFKRGGLVKDLKRMIGYIESFL